MEGERKGGEEQVNGLLGSGVLTRRVGMDSDHAVIVEQGEREREI